MFRNCLPEFEVNDQKYSNCTKEEFSEDDVTKPCSLFMKELAYQKHLDRKKNIDKNEGRYLSMDLNEFSNLNKSPIEIVIKVRLF